MRPTSTFLRAATLILAVACGGRAPFPQSSFPDDEGGTDAPSNSNSCFCEPVDASTPPPSSLEAGLDGAPSPDDAALRDD